MALSRYVSGSSRRRDTCLPDETPALYSKGQGGKCSQQDECLEIYFLTAL